MTAGRRDPRRSAGSKRRPRLDTRARITTRHGRSCIISLLIALVALPASEARAFRVEGAFQIGPAHIGVAFSDSVNAGEALQSSRYAVTPVGGAPAVTIQQVALQENQRTVYLVTAGTLPSAAGYQVTVTGVTSKHGVPLDPGGPAALTTVAETVMGIADVHANIGALDGQSVTVLGQVFVRASTVSGTPSGYIQDATGRGINVFGSPLQPAVDSIGTVAKVTGTVDLFFTTVELTSFTATPIVTRMPHIAPRVLSVAQASSPDWEGTYIQTTATLTGTPTASGSSHYNYPAADGSTPFIFRVRNATGINPAEYGSGDIVTGAGAGAVFSGTYQITVGNAFDFRRETGDVTPPTLVAAEGQGGSSEVSVDFSEAVAAGAADPASYTLHPSAAPGSPIAVTSATPVGARVTLALASALEGGVAYTLEVSGVEDAAGNAIAAGASIEFTAAAPAAFEVTGVFPFGADRIGVGFSLAPNTGEALNPASYAFTPPLAIAAATLQENGRTVILRTASPLPVSTSFSATVTGVTSAGGEPLDSSGPFAFATGPQTVVNIAQIHADLAAWEGQTVTVVGQTFIPVGSRGGTPSGYLQDGSGRGLNLFGGSIQGPVNQLGSVARVTGTLELYFETVEITGYTATAVASNQPHLGARRLTIPEANSSAWEGTYIEASGEITSIAPSGATNTNYDVTDGVADLTLRVGNGLGIPPTAFSVGQRVTGRGAGGAYQSTFQILVGNVADLFAESGGPDTTRPRVASATGSAGAAAVTLRFSEAVRGAEATTASNYDVHPAADPGAPLGVTGASLAADARTVTLALGAALVAGESYTVEVSNVADLAGNVILPGTAVTFAVLKPAARLGGPDGAPFPAATLIRDMAAERFRFEIEGVQDAKAVCRVFDVQGRLVKVLFDGKLTGTPRRALSWDARDDSFELVPAGLYVCLLETTDPSGHTGSDRAPIVVAPRLE